MYLDNAATSFPKPETVYAAADQWMRNNGAAFGRGSHAFSDASGQIVQQCRVQVARLLDITSADNVAFTLNCTDSLNLILRGLLRPGDRVVTTKFEHNSVLRPLTQLHEELGIQFELIDFDASTGLIDLPRFEQALHDRPTRLTVVSHASNVTGVVQPIHTMTEMAHAADSLVLLDAAQTAGHIPFSMQQLGVDFLAAAGHKGLLGPLGTGIVAIRSGCEKQIRPMRCGGTGSFSESLHHPKKMPQLLESGNLNLPGIAGLLAAVTWLSERSVNQIHADITRQADLLRNGLLRIDRVDLYPGGPKPNGPAGYQTTGIVAFNIGDMDCREAAMILDQSFNIQCRAGLHCAPLTHQVLGTAGRGGAIRISPGPFTTEEELAAAIEAVTAIADSV